MNDETDNPQDGTDNVTPQADDTAEVWDYYDPDEDQDTVEAPAIEATDDGTEAPEEDAAPEEPAEAPATAVVTLADGSKMKVQDLIQGHLRQEDYSRKTQAVANQRAALETEVQRLEGITQSFIDHLSGLVPAAPDAALALTNPGAFVAQKAQHEAALGKIQELIKIGEQPKAIKDGLSKQQHSELIAEENRKLADRFPDTATAAGREKFFASVATVAEQVGFSLQDLGKVTDHRVFALAHYAALGMKAEAARKVAATKVASAPPVAPKRPGQGNAENARNAEAVNKFHRTGNIKDAAKAGWL